MFLRHNISINKKMHAKAKVQICLQFERNMKVKYSPSKQTLGSGLRLDLRIRLGLGQR